MPYRQCSNLCEKIRDWQKVSTYAIFRAASKHTIHWHLIDLSGVVYCGMISKTRRGQVDLEAYTQYHARYERLRS